MIDPSENRPITEPEHRQNHTHLFHLVQLDPSMVIDGERVDNGFLADDLVVSGGMRETCPFCKTAHLKLVLRQANVKQAHMFCEQCTRCFDAHVRFLNYASALAI